MKYQTCKNCSFWGAHYEGCCNRVGDLHTGRDPSRAFEIDWFVLDDSGLEVFLKTGPDFGCVQFTQKEKRHEVSSGRI